jgi:hypothetical protein
LHTRRQGLPTEHGPHPQIPRRAPLTGTVPQLVEEINLAANPVNGDVTHCFALCFLVRSWQGEPRPDGEEATETRFVDPGVPPEPLHPPTAHALELLSAYLRSGSFQLR